MEPQSEVKVPNVHQGFTRHALWAPLLCRPLLPQIDNPLQWAWALREKVLSDWQLVCQREFIAHRQEPEAERG